MEPQHESLSHMQLQRNDTVWFNAHLATMTGDAKNGYGLVENGALIVRNTSVVWVGNTDDLPHGWQTIVNDSVDCEGRLVTPGLIDCHTHLVYAGDRSNEFEMRLNGATYEEIARAGGGIVSTVKATRGASEDELFAQSLRRLKQFLAEGVTTVEIKSGYGLDLENELKMLKVARKLGEKTKVNVTTTLLAAHATPPEFKGREDEYIDLVCYHILPAAAKQDLADSVDAFCENIGFSTHQVQRVFEAAAAHCLPIKLHAEQLSDQKGAKLAASYGALSVDHLEFLAEEDIPAFKQSNTVAVLLPGAYYFLRETQLPPVQTLRDQGVDMAIASDSNPGSSPVCSLLLMLNMACTKFYLTPAEALRGVTINAAKALGLAKHLGSIEAGKQADLVLWDVKNPAELSYHVGYNPCLMTMHNGAIR